MKAALFYGGPDIRVQEVATPVPGAGQVLVRVEAAGVCGSDLHGYRDRDQRLGQPYMKGHELAGIPFLPDELVAAFPPSQPVEPLPVNVWTIKQRFALVPVSY